jgi:uncharacterized protein YukE
MLPGIADLEAYRGDTWAQTFRFLESGVPVDLTDSVVTAWARPFGGGHVDLPVSVGENGEVTLAQPAGGWNGSSFYTYDVEVTHLDSTVRTWVRGTIKVLEDITNAE